MWHKGVAALNWPTRMALSVLFGGMPEASNDKAVECLEKANQCYPNATSVVERAKVLLDMGRKAEAKAALESSLDMDTDLPVYRKAQDEARGLLANTRW